MKPSYNKRDIAAAAHMWEVCGSQGLSLWYTQHKTLCAGDYGALVKEVRAFLGDTTDYSKEEQEANQ